MITFKVQNNFVSPQAGGSSISFKILSGNLTIKSDTVNYIAAEAIGGHRIVTVNELGKIIYADKDQSEHVYKVLGISKNAIEEGASGEIQSAGEMIEPSWNWTPNLPIYLGNNGLMTQTVITSGFILQIAFAVTATKIFVGIKQSIKLS